MSLFFALFLASIPLDRFSNSETNPAVSYFTKDSNIILSITPSVEVLRIKRPYIRIKDTQTIVVCVSPEEWSILKVAYADQLENADSKGDLIFMAYKKDTLPKEIKR